MKLRPHIPFFEIVAVIGLLILSITHFLLSLDKSDWTITLAAGALFLLIPISIWYLNGRSKKFTISESIIVEGYFWGKEEIAWSTVKSFYLKKLITQHLLKSHTLILFDYSNQQLMEINPLEYRDEQWKKFIELLKAKGIQELI